jgi:hypothetical protein
MLSPGLAFIPSQESCRSTGIPEVEHARKRLAEQIGILEAHGGRKAQPPENCRRWLADDRLIEADDPGGSRFLKI